MLPKQTGEKFLLSSSPHAHADASTSRIMLDVVIALLPALCCGVYFFGFRVLLLTGTCIAASLVTEALCRLAMKRENTIGDLSAVVTGLLLALNLPPDLPVWMAALGGAFAISVAKQVFGGLGYNPFNPALAARAFLLISFTGPMTTWTESAWRGADAVTTATPLALIKKGAEGFDWSQAALLKDLFLGNVNGCIGEVSALALLIGAIYLLVRKVITWHIPVSFLATVFIFAMIKGGVPPLVHVLSGGCVIGACFMATDYVTSPITARGKLIFGCGCGLLTMLIRTAPTGAYPEGVSFSILIMNGLTPLINRFTQPKPFGKVKK